MQHTGVRAQVTIFALLGIVLLIIIGAALFIRNALLEAQLAEQAGTLAQQFSENENVKTHIQHCIGTILRKATEDLTTQGGILYTHQGGNTPYNPSELGNTHIKVLHENVLYNVTYGLKGNDGIRLPLAPLAYSGAHYPAPNITIQDMNAYYLRPTVYHRYDGYYGDITLPKLCNSTGPNRIGGAGTTVRTFTTCEPFSYNPFYDNTPTLQDTLARYLEASIPHCINLTEYADRYGSNITATAPPKANITYTDETIIATLTYPLSVRLATDDFTTTATFTTELPIRLKLIYEIATRILKEESKTLDFSLTDDTQIILDHYNAKDIEIHYLKDICGQTGACQGRAAHDDALLLIDHTSLLSSGKKLTLITAIEDRPPVLDWIHIAPDVPYHATAVGGETLTITPQAIDPDEGPVTITYEGWGQNHTDLFMCTEAQTIDALRACTQRAANTPQTPWMSSAIYQSTGTRAELDTQETDQGYHTLTITAHDDSGKTDHQEIHIIIYPLPQAQASGWHPNPSLPPDQLSLEDPYCFDARGSQASFGSLTRYTWTIAGQDYDGALICLPAYTYDIADIKNLLAQPFLPYVGTTHEARLVVQSETFYSSPATWTTRVQECLPLTGTDNPYPYNNSDGYLSNRPCCNQGSYASTATPCYQESLTGPYWLLTPPQSTNKNPPQP
ncbi:MAG: hypothetical protein HC945_04120, partial [Nitrosarchaeum sp.]|nr:hypothetical protein [Nitrosarchaeum sp.]